MLITQAEITFTKTIETPVACQPIFHVGQRDLSRNSHLMASGSCHLSLSLLSWLQSPLGTRGVRDRFSRALSTLFPSHIQRNAAPFACPVFLGDTQHTLFVSTAPLSPAFLVNPQHSEQILEPQKALDQFSVLDPPYFQGRVKISIPATWAGLPCSPPFRSGSPLSLSGLWAYPLLSEWLSPQASRRKCC